jgi:hypothetical protein
VEGGGSAAQPPNLPSSRPKSKISPEWAKCLANFADYFDSIIGDDFDGLAQ